MPGRRLLSESELAQGRYAGPKFVRRREVLRETLAAFEARGEALRAHAEANLLRWRKVSHARPEPRPLIMAADWGQATLELTQRFGVAFAVLNMANAFLPGGAYVEGTAAQEENLFRRTDTHFHVPDDDLVNDRYAPRMTALLSAEDGRVYFDARMPRICVRGPEDRSRDDLGYPWLADEDIFLFYELRAAAQDVRRGNNFDPHEARRRIEAQLDTLVDAGQRYAVLSAFGCGAFANPPETVATIYLQAWRERREAFDCLAFAIFYPGYGPDNFKIFRRVFRDA